jgi:hypothetical protein
MIYVYGSGKFVKTVWRACGRVVVLNDVSAVSGLPRGAVLYVESLKTAVKTKLKAPWLTVRTATFEVEDVKLVYVDVYYMLRGIEMWGTCHVYVPDDALRQALRQIAGSTHIEFVESRRPTYPCAPHKPSKPDLDELLREAFLSALSRPPTYVGPHTYPRPIRRYTIPIIITDWAVPKPRQTTEECTAVGTPLFNVDWDYYIDYPLAASPERLAELLRRRKLFFQKAAPKLKPLKSLCPKTDPYRMLLAPHRRA